MITIADDALQLIEQRQTAIHIEAPLAINGCCIEMTECPAVKFGAPKMPTGFSRQQIQGVELFLPAGFPQEGDFVIRSRSLLGRHWLVLEGWKLA